MTDYSSILNGKEILQSVMDADIELIFCCFTAEGLNSNEWDVLKRFIDSSLPNGQSLLVIRTSSAEYPVLKYMATKSIPVYVITTDSSFTPMPNEIPIYLNLGAGLTEDENDSILLAKLEQFAVDNSTGIFAVSESDNKWVRANFEISKLTSDRKKKGIYFYRDMDSGNWVKEMITLENSEEGQ